jgi:hypothetical protein
MPTREDHMPEKTLFIVQHFDKQGRKLAAGRAIEVSSSDAAVLRAERDAPNHTGVVALTQTIDTDTGEVVEEPRVLARHGELPQEFAAE